MRGNGDQLIAQDSYAVDSIRPKCIELQRMCDQYKSLLRRRREMLNKSHDLQDRIDKVRDVKVYTPTFQVWSLIDEISIPPEVFTSDCYTESCVEQWMEMFVVIGWIHEWMKLISIQSSSVSVWI